MTNINDLTPTEQMILEGQAPDTVELFVNVYLGYEGHGRRPKITTFVCQNVERAHQGADAVIHKKVLSRAQPIEVPIAFG